MRSKPHWGIVRMTAPPVSVIEFAGYRHRANELLTAEQRDAVIDLIAYEPECGDIIPGSGGLAALGSFTIFTMRVFRFCYWRFMPKMKKAI